MTTRWKHKSICGIKLIVRGCQPTKLRAEQSFELNCYFELKVSLEVWQNSKTASGNEVAGLEFELKVHFKGTFTKQETFVLLNVLRQLKSQHQRLENISVHLGFPALSNLCENVHLSAERIENLLFFDLQMKILSIEDFVCRRRILLSFKSVATFFNRNSGSYAPHFPSIASFPLLSAAQKHSRHNNRSQLAVGKSHSIGFSCRKRFWAAALQPPCALFILSHTLRRVPIDDRNFRPKLQ